MKKITAKDARRIAGDALCEVWQTNEAIFALNYINRTIEEAAKKGFDSATIAYSDLVADKLSLRHPNVPSQSIIVCIKWELTTRGFTVVETHLNIFGKSVQHFIITW